MHIRIDDFMRTTQAITMQIVELEKFDDRIQKLEKESAK